jgi:hypothetical protein
MTMYAVITLVMEPIGRAVLDDRDQMSAPVAELATIVHRACTPAGSALTAARAAGAMASPAAASPVAVAPVTAMVSTPRRETTRLSPIIHPLRA